MLGVALFGSLAGSVGGVIPGLRLALIISAGLLGCSAAAVLIGIPKENYGFSRDARGKFGPPDFDDAAIEVKDEVTVAMVRLH